MKTRITYFRAEGTTAKDDRDLALAIDADLFEIKLKNYSSSYIRWTNPLLRCNREKNDNKDVQVVSFVENSAGYNTVLIGLPIWKAIGGIKSSSAVAHQYLICLNEAMLSSLFNAMQFLCVAHLHLDKEQP